MFYSELCETRYQDEAFHDSFNEAWIYSEYIGASLCDDFAIFIAGGEPWTI